MLKKNPVTDRPVYYHKERKVLEDLVDPQMVRRFKRPISYYEYVPEYVAKQKNGGFPLSTFQTAYLPHAPFRYAHMVSKTCLDCSKL